MVYEYEVTVEKFKKIVVINNHRLSNDGLHVIPVLVLLLFSVPCLSVFKKIIIIIVPLCIL